MAGVDGGAQLETWCSRAKGAGSHSQEENGAVLLEQAQPGEEAEVAGEGEVWAVRGGAEAVRSARQAQGWLEHLPGKVFPDKHGCHTITGARRGGSWARLKNLKPR